MSERIWDKYLTDRDRQIFSASGWEQRIGFGERPALIVVDVNINFVGEEPEPILDAIKKWPMSCGDEGWTAMAVINKLSAAARAKGLPVIFTTFEWRPDGFDFGGWAWKNSRAMEDQRLLVKGNEVSPELAPQPTDIVLIKKKPSAFFGTPLMGYLTDLKVDSLLVTGTTTSGCVRATVIDGFSHNIKCTLVEDGCFDRSEISHAINLFDMNAKAADVRPSEEVLEFIESLPDGLFDLPKGQAIGSTPDGT
jgi:nicotinamidase-related amidase